MTTYTPPEQALVSITPRAAEKALGLISERGVAEGALRVFVVGGGCSGFQYGMSLAEGTEPDDTVIESAGVRILIDAE